MNAPIANRFLRTIISLLFIVYCFTVIKLVLLKDIVDIRKHFPEDYNLANLNNNFKVANFIPFHTLHCYIEGSEPMRYTTENLVGNILLFIPLGIFLPLLFEKVNTLRKVLLYAFAVSSFLEIIQLFTLLGNFDIDDILLNVLGAFVGFGGYRMTWKNTAEQHAYISE